jgi:hypothetical protein
MAYQINKTDGSVLTIVPDGQIDENSTNLTLIGKNFSGFGEAFNENLVKLLENFADSRAPDKPITGQVWFDVSEFKLKVYNGIQFVPVSSATISSSRPDSLGIGDLWYDSVNRQLFFFDGNDTILLAPLYTAGQGVSGLQVRSILDSLNQTRVITLLYNNGILIGIFAKDSFIPKSPIEGFSGNIEPGFNAGVLTGIKFRVTVTNSERLGGADALTYVRRDTSNSIAGQLRLTSDLGLVIGSAGQGNFVINDGNLLINNAAAGRTIAMGVRRGIDQEAAIVISPNDRSIDLYSNFINSQTNIGGNLTISGNLTVQGTTTTINTATLTIEDKTLNLASQTGVVPTDVNADGGGFILEGDTQHIFLWSLTGNDTFPNPTDGQIYSRAWNTTENINLARQRSFLIDGVPLFEQIGFPPAQKRFRLTEAVTEILGVTSFGTQVVVNIGPGDPPVAQMRLETNSTSGNPRISTISGNQDLELAPNGTGNVVLIGSPRITGLANPISGPGGAQDAATREYVDNLLQTARLVLSIDLSDNKPNSYIISNILNRLYPPAEFRNGTEVKVLCSIASNSSGSVDLGPLVTSLPTAEFITPNAPSSIVPGGTAFAVTGVQLGIATVPPPSITVIRQIRFFDITGGAWSHRVGFDINLPL